MLLTELYMQGVQAKSKTDYAAIATTGGSTNTGKTNQSERFASFMNQAESQKSADASASKRNDYGKNQGKASAALNGSKADQVKAGQAQSKETPKTEASKKSGNAPKAGGANKEFSDTEFDAAGKDVLEKLAQALNIPLEALQQALISLNIKPLELQDSAKMSQLVQKLVGAESRTDLLQKSQAPEMLDKISGVMTEFEDVAKAFIRQMENDEMGRPKFVMSEPQQPDMTAAQTVNAAPVKNMAQAIGTDDHAAMPLEDDGQAQAADTTQPKPVTISDANSVLNQEQGQAPGQGGKPFSMAGMAEAPHDGIAPVQATATNHVDFEKTVAKNESLKNVDTADVIHQIVEKMKVEVKGDTSEIRITLRPEHLGDVTLKIATQNGVVTAQFMAENQRVKEILESGFQQLKQSLQDQGINVSQLSVSVGQENAGEQMRQFAQQQERSSARINQIIQNIESEEAIAAVAAYARENQVYDINVDYKA